MSDRMTLASPAEATFEEKKSVFIGYAAPVKTEDEAKAIIEAKKKEFADATHNVWAYYIDDGARARYSDDGEPQGTAGMPVLNVLKMSGATDMCVVVTRYFGGTLLGAGGLVRAYGASAKAAIDAAGFAASEEYTVYSVAVSYSDYQKLIDKLKKINANEDSSDFGTNVTLFVSIETKREDEVPSLINELTGGKGKIEKLYTEERLRRI